MLASALAGAKEMGKMKSTGGARRHYVTETMIDDEVDLGVPITSLIPPRRLDKPSCVEGEMRDYQVCFGVSKRTIARS